MSFLAGRTKYTLLLSLLLFACQSAENNSFGKLIMPEPSSYKSFVLPFADSTSPKAKALIGSLDSFYAKEIAKGFNGSVLVGYKGNILYERYFGMANRAKNIPLSKSTPSQLASTSKPFTATAILWLHQQGYMNIDSPVTKYLKDFPYTNISIKELLNQRSGLQDYTKMGLQYWKEPNIMYNEDLLQIFKKNKPRLLFTPGTKFNYSNSNYAMLARVIEEVSAMSYARFMRTFIFEPLGMTNTFVYDPKEITPATKTISYMGGWKVYEDMYADGVYGDKGIFSTVEDMYKWDQSLYKNILLNDKSLKMAYTPYSKEMSGHKNYGLGWRMINDGGYQVIYHNGWWHGNNTVFYRFIKDNLTLIVLGNKYNTGIYRQAKPLYNIVRSYESSISEIKEMEDAE